MTQEQAGWTSYTEYRQRFEGKQEEERMEWDRTRWQMFLAMQMHPNIKRHQKPATPQAWIRFPWEAVPVLPEDITPISEKGQASLTAMLEDYLKKNNKTIS